MTNALSDLAWSAAVELQPGGRLFGQSDRTGTICYLLFVIRPEGPP